MSADTDLRDRLHAAGSALAPPRVDARRILQKARRRRRRRRLLASGGIGVVLAVVLGVALVPSPSPHKRFNPVTPADSVGTVRLGNTRLRPVVHHPALKLGDEVTVDGEHFWLTIKQIDEARFIAFCGGGPSSTLSDSCEYLARQGKASRTFHSTDSNYSPATSPVAGSQAPMVLVGVTPLRLTYGLLFNKTGRGAVHTAQTPYGTVFWGVLARERRSKPAEHLHRNGRVTYGPGRVPYTTDALYLRMVSTNATGRVTASVCLPPSTYLHCKAT